MCAFGCPCKKCTCFLTNFEPLRGLERGCPGLSPTHHHLPLCGSLQIFERGRPRWVCATAWAGECPHPLCRRWVQLLPDNAPVGALDCSHGRGAKAGLGAQALQADELAAAASELSGALRSAQGQRSSFRRAAVTADGEPPSSSQARVDIGGSSGSGYCSLAKEFLRAGGVAPFRRGG